MSPDRILVAIATLDRPEMLRRALVSLNSMKLADTFEVSVLVVENRYPTTANALISELFTNFRFNLILLSAHDRGTSNARNVAIDYSLSEGYNWLCFIDDDEEVHTDWLVNLHAAVVANGYDLAGGACLPVNTIENLSICQSLILRMICDEWVRDKDIWMKSLSKGSKRQLYVKTANWICRTKCIRKHSLRFLPELDGYGGEDCAFSEISTHFGMKLGFAADALVFETVPASRLSISYLFLRHCIFSVGDEKRYAILNGRSRSARSLISLAAENSVKGLVHLLSIPFSGRSGILRSVIRYGIAAGKIRYLFKKRNINF